MPLIAEDRAFLRKIHTRLTLEPLEPGTKLYAELYEPVYERLAGDDPVSLMRGHIEFSTVESLQLFSGFRGSGKTTELKRLQEQLEGDGYYVVYADALEYVNPAEPVEVAELLMVLAGAFSDELHKLLGAAIAKETFWSRLEKFLKTELKVSEAAVKIVGESPFKGVVGGLKTGLDIKFALKTPSSFRDDLQKFLASRLKQLQDQVTTFVELGVKAVKKKHGDETRVVFIFDQLEKVQGTLQTERDVIHSVDRLFSVHLELLRLHYVHMIFTVPPWLKFLQHAQERVRLLPITHLWENDPGREPCEQSWDVYRSLVERRLGRDGLDRLFGPEADTRRGPVDRIIGLCGGHFRDLLRMLQETVLRALSLDSLPVPERLVDSVINATRRDFLPIAEDDARWLERIQRNRATALPSTEPEFVNRLARFLDNHWVLYFINGEEWYDTHPLIRDEVAAVVQAADAAAPR